MKTFVVVAALCAVGYAAPSQKAIYGQGLLGYGVAPGVVVGSSRHVVAAGPPQAHVTETVHPGPVEAQTYVQHGVVGHRTVQVGSKPVQVGHQYLVADQKVSQRPAYSFQVGEAVNTAETRPLPLPALPEVGPIPYAAIPPRPSNQGPAPIDTVTQEVIRAPVRTHTHITPRVTQVVPELKVNRYAVDVPVPVKVPVHREVIVQKNLAKPYAVEVPRAVPVPTPFKVHDVHEVVQTPVIHEHTYSVHGPAYAAVGLAGNYANLLPAGLAVAAENKEY